MHLGSKVAADPGPFPSKANRIKQGVDGLFAGSLQDPINCSFSY